MTFMTQICFKDVNELNSTTNHNPDGWGAYVTPETLNRYTSKWPEVKIYLIQELFLTKFIRIISC
jgi:hypothetical protein